MIFSPVLHIRPGKLDYLFLIHKIWISMRAGGQFPYFIIKENTPNQVVCYYKAKAFYEQVLMFLTTVSEVQVTFAVL